MPPGLHALNHALTIRLWVAENTVHVNTSVFLLNLISELLGFLCACKRNVLCVVNPVLYLGGDKNLTGETVLFCCLSLLEKVLRDLLLQLFMHSSFTAVVRLLQCAELTEHYIVVSLSKLLPHFRSLWVTFSLLQLSLRGNSCFE